MPHVGKCSCPYRSKVKVQSQVNCWVLCFTKEKTLLVMSPLMEKYSFLSLVFQYSLLSFSSFSVIYIFISMVCPLVLLVCPLVLVCLELLVIIHIFFFIYIFFHFTGCIWSQSQISHRKTDKLKLNNQVFNCSMSTLFLQLQDPIYLLNSGIHKLKISVPSKAIT